MPPILQVTNLHTYFHGKDGVVPAVDGISFDLDAGRVLAIVGESGCGKSVTALSIMKLLPAKSAVIEPESSIRLQGEELTAKTNKEMCSIRGNRIAMIFQDPMTSLNPVFTIGRQLAEPFMLHKGLTRRQADAAACDILNQVGISSPRTRLKEYPHQFSGGMKQRIMIAMALSCEPDILIADEPTTALDVTIQAQILRLIKELSEKHNTSIILITHDFGVVAEMADDVMVMYAGHIMEHADIKTIFSKPLHPYTKGLLNSIPRLDCTVERLHTIKGSVPSMYEMPQGCKFSNRCPYVQPRCLLEPPQAVRINRTFVKCYLYERGQGDE